MSLWLDIDMESIGAMAWNQAWQVTLVALVLGAMARLLDRRRPRLAYTLWMLVLVKAVVPPVVSSPAGVFSRMLTVVPSSAPKASFAVAEPPPVAGAVGPIPPLAGPIVPRGGAAALLSGPTGASRSPLLLAATWAIGLAVGVGLVAGQLVVHARRIRRSRCEADDDLKGRFERVARRLGIRRPVRLLLADGPYGPAAFGVIRPTVILPEALVRGLGPERLDLVLAHELVHIKRHDAPAGLLQLSARLLWWFHPLVWWAGREASRERERCCDEEVVERLGCTPAEYARGLLDVLDRKRELRPVVALPGMRPFEINARRLEHIMKYRDAHPRRTSILCRLVFAAGSIFLVPGAGQAPPRAEKPEEDARREWARAVAEWGKNSRDTFDTWSKDWAKQMDYRKHLTSTLQAGGARTPGPKGASFAGAKKEGDARAEAKDADKAAAPMDDTQVQLLKAQDRLDWANKMFEKGYVSKAQLDQERLKVQSLKDTQELQRMEDRLDWAERMFGKGPISRAQRERDELRRLKARQDLALATSDLRRVEDRLDWATRMFAKGYVSNAQLASEKLAHDKAKYRLYRCSLAADLAEKSPMTLKGIVRDKVSGQPLAGIQVSTDTNSGKFVAVTDAAGHYALAGLPSRELYVVTAQSISGEPYLINSRTVVLNGEKPSPSADLELFRGVPFRISILDTTTGKPIRGQLIYFPLSRNDPARWGAHDWAPAPGLISGALYTANPDGDGRYRGGLLPGPGVLCMAVEGGKWSWKRGDRETALFLPDGLVDDRIESASDGQSYTTVRMGGGDNPTMGVLLLLSHYPAAIVLNPRPGAKEVVHEIRIPDPAPMGTK